MSCKRLFLVDYNFKKFADTEEADGCILNGGWVSTQIIFLRAGITLLIFVRTTTGIFFFFFYWEGYSWVLVSSPPHHLLPNTRSIGDLARLFHCFRCWCCWASLWCHVLTGVHLWDVSRGTTWPEVGGSMAFHQHRYPFFFPLAMSLAAVPALLIIAKTPSNCPYQAKKASIHIISE